MTKEDLYRLLEDGPVILDGATGTNLMKAGLPMGCCPEDWIRKNPKAMLQLQKEYVKAGTKILYAPTFTANRIKLAEYGLEGELEEINRAMVSISRQAAGDHALVAGDLTMTGQQLTPLGELDFEELVEVYKEQVNAILKEGVDLFVVETMMSLQESRAAVLAIKETCDLPVMVSLSYNEDGRTLYGTAPDTAIIVLQSLGADVVGLNCSTGPLDMIPLIQQMRRYATVPILAKPNAGLPELIDEKTVYSMTPAEFAEDMCKLVEAGAAVVGGCCGTTPEHIRAMAKAVQHQKVLKPDPQVKRVVTSERANVEIGFGGRFLVIGERINPTGKKKLQEELRAGSLDMVTDFARSQEENGADILDINMGTNGIDEKEMMLRAIEEVTYTVDCPLCIDTSYPEVMEAALRRYPGRALINSISGEEERMEQLIPIAKKYGAMFIVLPLSNAGLPKSIEEKHQNLDRVLTAVREAGMDIDRCVVDLLVATVGADPSAALSCFATIDYCNSMELPTVCGLSNISFGLPQRAFVNTAFLNMAITKGLTMAIANPSQEMLMYTALAADMLLHKDTATQRYLSRVPSGKLTVTSGKEKKEGDTSQKDPAMHPVMECVVKGQKDKIRQEIRKSLDEGESPKDLLDQQLIGGINLVGKYYDEKKYFLPQLIAGANAMEEGVAELEPLLSSKDAKEKETIVIATVEGDIHDIGKNLVALMLRNYGYHVIDLGKDVSAEVIVDTALARQASVIGLSALMTTTMTEMKKVVQLCKERSCPSKIVIGGACITQSYAEEIQADGYSKDAADCVKLVEKLLSEDENSERKIF
ncbi:5-methyltetrahydrofolate--homocysteine methyltransferase [Lachnospiraceae bacterium KHCPX20]|nr:5-methyltetrahydrofolate--homocysteine methyltransferase [Lachnospiraceae bacterium KHCPX20]